MLRVLRVCGIVVFALFVGISANALRSMHESGELFERYCSRRKPNITLLLFSGISLGVLGCYELTRFRRMEQRRGYGGFHYQDDADNVVDDFDTTSIYAAPKKVDEWQGRRPRVSPPRRKPRAEAIGVWEQLLRVLCVAFPLVYMALLAFLFLAGSAGGSEFTLLISAFSFLTLFSTVVAVGVFCKQLWGLTCGYLLALFNLIIFPYGTVGGLFLLMGLVGASSAFADTALEKRRQLRRKTEPLFDRA